MKTAILALLLLCACDGTEPPPPVGPTRAVCLPTCDNPIGAEIPGECAAVEMHCDEDTGIITGNATLTVQCEWGCYPGTADDLPQCRCVYEQCNADGEVVVPAPPSHCR